MNLYRTLRSLRDQERGIKPDATWVRATRETLLMQVRNAMPTAEVAAKYRIPVFGKLYERLMLKLRGPMIATLSIATVVLGGSIASVSAAEKAIPGDALYNVKLVTEQARLVFVGSTDKVKLKAAFTKRRVEELKTIVTTDVTEKDVRAALATDVLKRDLDTLKQQMTDVQNSTPTADTLDAAKEVDKSTVEVSKGLAEAKDALSPDVQVKVTDAQQQAADVGIQALEVMVAAKADDGSDAVSNADISSSLAAHAEVTAQSVADARASIGAPPANVDGVTSTPDVPIANPATVSTSTLQLAQDAEQALATVQQLTNEQKIPEAMGALKDATAKSLTLQKQAQQDVIATAAASAAAVTSTSMVLPTDVSVSSTVSASSTPSGVPTTSSTKISVPSTTSTKSTKSTGT